MGSKESLEKIEKALATYYKFNHFTDWVDSMTESLTPPKKDFVYHYGTRWFDFTSNNDGDGSLFVDGQSAWSPPLEMTRSLCEHFGVIAKHEYDEMGNDFGGFIRILDNGSIAEQQEYSYNEWRYMEDADSYLDNLCYDIEHDDLYESLEELLEDNKFLSKKYKDDLEKVWYKYRSNVSNQQG